MSQVILTLDLGFGDAGKGSVVDALTRQHQAHTVIRYNGGAQAAHRVVTDGETPQEHVFSQFGSGTLAGAATHLSRFMLVDPLAMEAEEAHLQQLGISDAFARTTIAADALVITPFARAINRLRELARGRDRHGSCGMGIGETVVDSLAHGPQVLRIGDLNDPQQTAAKLHFLRRLAMEKLHTFQSLLPGGAETERELDILHDPSWLSWLRERYAAFAARTQIVDQGYLRSLLQQPGCVLFEGAQGVLLDEWRGFHPYTTWSTTTLANAELLLREAEYQGKITRVGITRAYTTRHGAGPLPSENTALSRMLPDARNTTHPWQQHFRVGWLDLVLLRYACALSGPLDYLALTCLDRLAALPELHICNGYRLDDSLIEHLTPSPTIDLDYQERMTNTLQRCQPHLQQISSTEELAEILTAALGIPIGMYSYGPSAADKQLMELTL